MAEVWGQAEVRRVAVVRAAKRLLVWGGDGCGGVGGQPLTLDVLWSGSTAGGATAAGFGSPP